MLTRARAGGGHDTGCKEHNDRGALMEARAGSPCCKQGTRLAEASVGELVVLVHQAAQCLGLVTLVVDFAAQLCRVALARAPQIRVQLPVLLPALQLGADHGSTGVTKVSSPEVLNEAAEHARLASDDAAAEDFALSVARLHACSRDLSAAWLEHNRCQFGTPAQHAEQKWYRQYSQQKRQRVVHLSDGGFQLKVVRLLDLKLELLLAARGGELVTVGAQALMRAAFSGLDIRAMLFDIVPACLRQQQVVAKVIHLHGTANAVWHATVVH